MATMTRAEASRINGMKSRGPRTAEGKTASAGNSTTHGLCAGLSVGAAIGPEFDARLAHWAEEIRPRTAEGKAALVEAVALTFRIEECAAAYRAAVDEQRQRARLAWDQDRMVEAALLLGRLAKRPEVVAPQLLATARGVGAVLDIWGRLREAAESGWGEPEVATACDLLGIPAHLRQGGLPFDPNDPSADPRASRLAFARREIDRLAELRAQLDQLDAFLRDQAESGASSLLSKPVQLVLRYEAAALRRFDRAIRAAKAAAEAPDIEPSRGFDPGPAVVEGDDPTDLVIDSPDLTSLLSRVAAQVLESAPTRPHAPSATPGQRPNRRQRRKRAALDRQRA